MTELLIDTVAGPERAKLQILRAQQETVRATIRDLQTVSKNDDFFSVANAELAEASNADRVLVGELKILEGEIRERIDEARRDADARYLAETQADTRDLLKAVERARDLRRKMVRRYEAYVEHSGSTRISAVPFAWLEIADAVAATLRAEGAL